MEPEVVNPALIEDAEVIAHLYRRLVLLIGVQLLGGYAINAMAAAFSNSILGGILIILGFVVLVAVIVMIVITAYRLAGRLNAGQPVLWAIAMFIPCVNLIALLALSGKAQTWCRRYGIKVGLLGPTKESLAELRRRVVTSNFE